MREGKEAVRGKEGKKKVRKRVKRKRNQKGYTEGKERESTKEKERESLGEKRKGKRSVKRKAKKKEGELQWGDRVCFRRPWMGFTNMRYLCGFFVILCFVSFLCVFVNFFICFSG